MASVVAARTGTSRHTPDCPVCGKPDGRVIWTVSAARAATQFVLPRSDPDRHDRLTAHITSLWNDDRCRTRICSACGFGWADPDTAGDSTFYELAAPHTAYPPNRWEFHRTIAALRAHPRLWGGDLLEVGGGVGHFVRLLIAQGWPRERMHELEYASAGLAEFARLGVRAEPVEVRMLAGRERFDAICMFHVLEHLSRLDDIFAALARLLRPGGGLFIAVPNAAWTERNEAAGLLLDMPPQHVGRWRLSAFAALCERLGWRIEVHAAEAETRLRAARTAFEWRYLRRAADGAVWPGTTARLACRLSRRPQRMAKAIAAALDPPCLLAFLRGAAGADCPPSIWLHLTRSGDRCGS